MSTLLIVGLVLAGVALALSLLTGYRAMTNMQKGFTGKQSIDKTFDNHFGAMKRGFLGGALWFVAVVVILIAVVRDYVLPALGN